MFTDPLFLWALAVASVCSVSCAVVGCFLVLKRMSLMGDAINHGLLPGIVLAVAVSGSLTSFYLLLGAVFFGLLTAFLAQTLHSWGKVDENSSLGIVFTSLFALGVFLISTSPRFRQADLDTDCVFLGHLEHVALQLAVASAQIVDTIREADSISKIAKAAIATWDDFSILRTQIVTLFLTLGFTLLAWKEMKIAVFDPALATALGYRATLLHYVLIALVAAVTVVSFEAVGSILVLAMLIVPAATAQLLTDRLASMFVVAALSALVSAFVGCWLGQVFDVNYAGMMATAAGAQFGLVVLAAPRHGILAKLAHR